MRNKTTLTLTAAALLLIACGSGEITGPGAQDDDSTTSGNRKTIVMTVTGPASADITFGLGGDPSQEIGAKLPWRKELTSGESAIFPSIDAQSTEGDGKIECTITIDGELVKENASSGEYAIVTCTADSF